MFTHSLPVIKPDSTSVQTLAEQGKVERRACDDDGEEQLSQLPSPDYLPGVVLTCCTLYLIQPHNNLPSRDHALIYKDEETASKRSSNISKTPQLISDGARMNANLVGLSTCGLDPTLSFPSPLPGRSCELPGVPGLGLRLRPGCLSHNINTAGANRRVRYS